jgi:hypothetical protein
MANAEDGAVEGGFAAGWNDKTRPMRARRVCISLGHHFYPHR